MTPEEENSAYRNLGPDQILDAVESVGYRCNGRLLALNSYENRVYQVGVEEGTPLVAKFYRPARWSDAAILEEHQFILELADLEIPVVAPLVDAAGRTLHHFGPFRFSLTPRQGGRSPELDDFDHLQQLGRFLGRIHALGAIRPFRHRPVLDIQHFGVESVQTILESSFLTPDLHIPYRGLTEDLIKRMRAIHGQTGAVRTIRLHGDCHQGNVLWNDEGPHFVDFDDARTGPAIQDLWMCLSGERDYQERQLAALLAGYTQFCSFDHREIALIESLRTLRMMHHAAWIARRWSDPAFPRAFPWFNTPRYWEGHILELREQAALLEELPLGWDPEAYS